MNKTYIIAELSANHGNDKKIIIDTINAIKDCGADAIKVQTFTADSLTMNINNEYFGPKKSGPWKGKRPYDVFSTGALSREFHEIISNEAEKVGLDFFSSPFDLESVEYLESLNVPKYKIASFEINHIPLIEACAKTKKPIIISTGVANLDDIKLALQSCYNYENFDVTLLKCTSQYPAKMEDAHLGDMIKMKELFQTKVGLSDHTEGNLCAITAVSLGATIIEKHFILDKNIGGPDAFFSMEPKEFKAMVSKIRLVEKMKDESNFNISKEDCLRRRSIFSQKRINKGDTISSDNIKIVRPGHGLHPKYYSSILGKTSLVDIEPGTPIMIENLG